MNEVPAPAHPSPPWSGRLRDLLRGGLSHQILSLYVLQGVNYLIPLITIPYLARVLQPDRFGTVAFGQGFIAYLVLLVSFGFNWSGTRQISIHRDSPAAVSRIASTIWAAKTILALAGLAVLLLAAGAVAKIGAILPLALILFGAVIGEVLMPVWLFQGMERMAALTTISMAVRILSTVGIFALVRRPDDYHAYAALLAADALVAGSLGMMAGLRRFRIRLVVPRWIDVGRQYREGWALFLTCGASSLYTVGNSFILGLVTDHVTVGYFNAAERLVRAANQILVPIEQAVFPVVNKLARESRTKALRFVRRLLPVVAGIGLFVSLGLALGAPLIVRVVLGSGFGPSAGVLRVLAPVVLNLSLTTVWSTLLMIAFRRDWAILSIIAVAGVQNLLVGVFLAQWFGAVGMAAAYLGAETLVNVATFIYTLRQGINPLRIPPSPPTR